MTETPIRKVRIDNETWAAFERIAQENGETASGRLRRLVFDDVKEHS
ncbi:hypothetical protein [Microbacterium sp. KR10-403]